MSETIRSIQAGVGVVTIICTVGWGLLGGGQAGSVSAVLGDLMLGQLAVPILVGLIVVVGLEVVSLVGSDPDSGTDPVPDGGAIHPDIPNAHTKHSKGSTEWNSRWDSEDEI